MAVSDEDLIRLRARAEQIETRAAGYRTVFGTAVAKEVVEDLKRFCYAERTTHVLGDTHGSAQLEGRRQVWLRIQMYLGSQDGDLKRQILAQQGDSKHE